jgi:flagellar motor switch protein FliM
MSDTQIIVRPSGEVPGFEAPAPRSGMIGLEEHLSWSVLSRLPVLLTVRIAITRFKVKDLLRLESGQVLTTEWSQTRDVPLAVGEVRLGWSEFEVSGQRIGVRLTQLA